MLDDRTRAVLRSPVRQILNRSAGMRSLPDETELAELSMDDASRDRVRDAARAVVDTAERGGLRARAQARELAERLAEDIVSRVPREFADSVPVDSDGPNEPSSHDLAERIIQRRAAHPSSAESAEDRETKLRALQLIHGHGRSRG